jgi:hypothetical protein
MTTVHLSFTGLPDTVFGGFVGNAARFRLAAPVVVDNVIEGRLGQIVRCQQPAARPCQCLFGGKVFLP